MFGRREGADVFINDDHASRDHVELIGQTFAGQVSFMARNISSKGANFHIFQVEFQSKVLGDSLVALSTLFHRAFYQNCVSVDQ